MTFGEKRTQETLPIGYKSVKRSSAGENAPLGVAILFDVVLALAERVPELNCPVARARDDLPVVGREGNGQDIGGVADEAAGGVTGVKIPETEGVVPGRGECELAVRGDDNVRNKVIVSMENSFWVPVRVFVSGKLPDDDRLVFQTRRLPISH
jgi:hypothetical protein